MTTITVLETLVSEIAAFSTRLPPFVQQASKADKIWSVMNTDKRDMPHEAFNQCFDYRHEYRGRF